ncbi:uncharacterized protein LOC143339288 isoform X2 [Chaetodon auriga]|uniref:uncharacterized protein LOC143339288 isoform X2 n=1 Tax=Chaetodon auriga TaxID=39042 RepID=UPI004032FF93
MPGGSTKKTCPFCKGVLFCAQKVCCHCKKEQPLKQRLKKKLQRFDEKREEWVVGRKKNHNVASIKDEAIIMLEKLHAIGYKPILLLGKKTKKEQTKCEILTPRCTLTDFAQDYLHKIGSFYEYLCEGWTPDSDDNGEELITLYLTPCDPLEGTSQANMERQANTEKQVEQTNMEGQANTERQVEQTNMEGQANTERQVEEANMEGQANTERQVEEANMEGQANTERQVEEANMEGQANTERQVEEANMEGQANMERQVEEANTAKKSVATRHMPERKKLQKIVSAVSTPLQDGAVKHKRKRGVVQSQRKVSPKGQNRGLGGVAALLSLWKEVGQVLAAKRLSSKFVNMYILQLSFHSNPEVSQTTDG